ncbi:ROK family protein [Microtetraspora sp. AC03309]|uniref:ROK family protein n=1 Tax=Microtetraspora sp. AC03309 TaxID=2779376 RepID=UPI0027E048D9|nr:ROK family protein [Microtetraspora sp. AC03309]
MSLSGDVDRISGLVRFAPVLGWRDVDPAGLLADATGLAVTLENDVKALTVAEHWFGEGVGASSFALVTMGSGIGCGLVLDGRLVTGAYGVAGEIAGRAVGLALAAVVNLVGPERIVVSGDRSRNGRAARPPWPCAACSPPGVANSILR